MADANIQGHIDHLLQRMQVGPWSEFWTSLRICSVSFADIGLRPEDPDSVVWQRCQERGVLLLTNNRNDDRADSLESTLQKRNTAQSLPVFTIGDANRILRESSYCDSVIETLLEYLMDF